MAKITIQNSGKTIEASPAVSILNNLLRKEISIAHVCGGKAVCGTCQIKIIHGTEHVNKKNNAEVKRLASLGNPPDRRLACQTYAFDDITIKILVKNLPH